VYARVCCCCGLSAQNQPMVFAKFL
jgi:hypothetical protein